MPVRPRGSQTVSFDKDNVHYFSIRALYKVSSSGISLQLHLEPGEGISFDPAFVHFRQLTPRIVPTPPLREVPNSYYSGMPMVHPLSFDFGFAGPYAGVESMGFDLELEVRSPSGQAGFGAQAEFDFTADQYRGFEIRMGYDGLVIVKRVDRFVWTRERATFLKAGELMAGWDVTGAAEIDDNIKEFVSHLAPFGFISHLIVGTEKTAEDYLESIFTGMEQRNEWVKPIMVDPFRFAILHQMWGGLEMVLPTATDDWIEIYDVWQAGFDSTLSPGKRVIALVSAAALSGLAVTDYVGLGTLAKPFRKLAHNLAADVVTDQVRHKVSQEVVDYVADLAAKMRQSARILGTQKRGMIKEAVDTVEYKKEIQEIEEKVHALFAKADELEQLGQTYRSQAETMSDAQVEFLQHLVKTTDDWHAVSEAADYTQFMELTKDWSGSRRGYAFEYWLQINKAFNEPEAFRRWGHLTMESMDRTIRADRFFPKGADGAGRIWDFKHYKSKSRIGVDQLNQYISKLDEDPETFKGVVYLFSDEAAARGNLDYLEKKIGTGLQLPNTTKMAIGKEPHSRMVHILYIGTDGKIYRAGEITKDGLRRR